MNARNNRTWIRELASRGAVLLDSFLLVPLLLAAFLAWFFPKKIDVGLGPEPLINNIYHKKALQSRGYSAETFIFRENYITGAYDVNYHPSLFFLFFLPYWLFLRILFRYKILFIYFNGGPLAKRPLLRSMEPFFYRLAGIRVVVMPYGSDVQVLERSPNLFFKHAMGRDYAVHCKRSRRAAGNIVRWTRWADWIISGCEWVDYMYYWDTLLLGHFCIDLEQWKPNKSFFAKNQGLKILHAPNHQNVKGTPDLIKAVEQLKQEGLDIELIVLTKSSNAKIHEVMQNVDIVADQFVIGWYAMFAIEAMALEKPVLCYLREDLLTLYERAGLLAPGEIPILNTPLGQIAERLRWAYSHKEELQEIGKQGREYVVNHHSLEYIGGIYKEILLRLGEPPSS